MRGWPSFHFKLVPPFERIASAIYFGLLDDPEENTINPSGTSRERPPANTEMEEEEEEEEEEEDTGSRPEPWAEGKRD